MPPGFIHLGLFLFISNLKCVGGFWSQHSREPFHHQRQCPPWYWWKYVSVILRKNYISLQWNHWFIYTINDALSSTREEENYGVARLPNRCCQKRTGTAGRSYHLLLCHLHPSGLSFISDLVKTFSSGELISHSLFSLADWISALSPSTSQHGRKRGFWDPGAGFYGLLYSNMFVFFFLFACWHAVIFSFFVSPRPVSIRGQTALPQPENQRARQPSGRLALWHQRCNTCLI